MTPETTLEKPATQDINTLLHSPITRRTMQQLVAQLKPYFARRSLDSVLTKKEKHELLERFITS